jgi:hypothetical protein
MPVHVTWNEIREDAYCFVIADLTADGWELWERDSWEIRWFRMKATGELIAKAESFRPTFTAPPSSIGASR